MLSSTGKRHRNLLRVRQLHLLWCPIGELSCPMAPTPLGRIHRCISICSWHYSQWKGHRCSRLCSHSIIALSRPLIPKQFGPHQCLSIHRSNSVVAKRAHGARLFTRLESSCVTLPIAVFSYWHVIGTWPNNQVTLYLSLLKAFREESCEILLWTRYPGYYFDLSDAEVEINISLIRSPEMQLWLVDIPRVLWLAIRKTQVSGRCHACVFMIGKRIIFGQDILQRINDDVVSCIAISSNGTHFVSGSKGWESLSTLCEDMWEYQCSYRWIW